VGGGGGGGERCITTKWLANGGDREGWNILNQEIIILLVPFRVTHRAFHFSLQV